MAARGLDHPVVLRAREVDLAAALPALGEDCRDALWPDSSLVTPGFNILFVHLDEVLSVRDTSAGLRIAADGLVWPGALRVHRTWDEWEDWRGTDEPP